MEQENVNCRIWAALPIWQQREKLQASTMINLLVHPSKLWSCESLDSLFSLSKCSSSKKNCRISICFLFPSSFIVSIIARFSRLSLFFSHSGLVNFNSILTHNKSVSSGRWWRKGQRILHFDMQDHTIHPSHTYNPVNALAHTLFLQIFLRDRFLSARFVNIIPYLLFLYL